ncbi:MAG: HDIG domain-containing protein [Oligoflexia bacterium]|nr:HDIG domain-containing protein [Oligoflexia bacterium]MBF0364731.1 HDIG domain-containing protein [Oligoflexia bacterium]
MFKIILIDPDLAYLEKMSAALTPFCEHIDTAQTGQNAQIKLSQCKFDFAIIDVATTDHPSLSVVKYMKLNSPATKIIFTISDPSILVQLMLTTNDLLNIGISHILPKPFILSELLPYLQCEQAVVQKVTKTALSPMEEINDEKFTRIALNDLIANDYAIFDFYFRINKNQYQKVFSKHEIIDFDYIATVNQKKFEYLYFKTKDRVTYLSYLNSLVEKFQSLPNIPAITKVKTMQNLSVKFIEEVHASGLNPFLVAECETICQNMFSLVKKDKFLSEQLDLLQEKSYSLYYHSFLVSFLTTVACKSLQWETWDLIYKISMGALLHDIGKIKLSSNIMLLPKWEIPESLKAEYTTHTELGAKLLENCSKIPQEVKSIVANHHISNASDSLIANTSFHKVYPPAQLVGMVDSMANIMIQHEINVEKSLALLLSLPDSIPEKKQCHQQFIDAISKCFINHQK